MLIIQSDLATEFLTDDEIQELTGSKQLKQQMDWLNGKQWEYAINRQNKVKIGRWYARIKMAGVALDNVKVDTANKPRFDRVS